MIAVQQSAAECRYRAKPDESVRVGFRKEMLPLLRRLLVISCIFAAILGGCASRPPLDQGPLFGTGVFHPPPKPGTSISQTRMCECKACEPRNCCDGPDEDDTPPASCGSSYDFSDNEWCGTSIHSCTSRCAREVWRVSNSEACEVKRPASCCQAG